MELGDLEIQVVDYRNIPSKDTNVPKVQRKLKNENTQGRRGAAEYWGGGPAGGGE